MIKKKRILIDLDRLKDVHNGLGQIALNFGKYIQDLKDDRFEFTLLVPKQYIGYFGNNVNYETISIKRRYFLIYAQIMICGIQFIKTLLSFLLINRHHLFLQ